MPKNSKRKKIKSKTSKNNKKNIKSKMKIRNINDKSKIKIRNIIGGNFTVLPRKNDSVIIVGNSPIVLNNELGKIIDEYDIIVRFNQYQTINYEKYVGTKTSIWILNDLLAIDELTKNQEWLSNNNHVKILIVCPLRGENPDIFYNQQFDKINNHYLESNIKNDLIFMSKDFLKIMHEKYHIHPSTGLLCIANFMQLYNNITITGFNFFNEIQNNNKVHYYSDQLIQKEKTAHNSEAEKEIITKIIEESEIKKI